MAAVAASRGATVFLVREVLDEALAASSVSRLLWVSLAFIVVNAVHGGAEFGRTALTKGVGLKVTAQMRADLFQRIQALSLSQQARYPVGDLMARVTHDTAAAHWAVAAAVTALQKPLTVVVLLVAAVMQQPKLTAVAVLAIPLAGIPVLAFSRRVRRLSREQAHSLGQLSATLQESLSGQRVVKAFSGEDVEAQKFATRSQNQLKLQGKSLLAQAGSGPVVEVVASVAVAVVLYIGGLEVMAGRTTPGSLLAFLVSLGLMTDPLKGIAQLQGLIQQSLAAAERVFALSEEIPDIEDLPGARALDEGPLGVDLQAVTFSYGRGEEGVKGVSLQASPGEMVALVGESGSGKTTVLSLIQRLYDPQEGWVCVGGREVQSIQVSSLRRKVAWVGQDAFLFDDTVAGNIAYGLKDVPEGAIKKAARDAYAHDFIASLPLGYQTRVGQRGEALSAGQRQRIAIARAFLRDAPVLLLDEATSHLDPHSEAEVEESLLALMRDRTVLVVAHRLATVQRAHRIVVLKEGRKVEEGSHADLLQAGGEYARLWNRSTRSLRSDS